MKLSSNIAMWAYGNETRIEQVKEWHTNALQAIVAGGGRSVVQSTANNVSVTFSSGMTEQDWFNTLTEALAILQTGQFPSNKKYVYFPCPSSNNQ